MKKPLLTTQPDAIVARLNELDVEKGSVVKVDNINQMDSDVLTGLKCGDIVAKKTGNQYHAYVVSYKEENHGICMTYVDAGYMETVSYDWNDTTKKWVYNSTDVVEVTPSKMYCHNIHITETFDPSGDNGCNIVFNIVSSQSSLTINSLAGLLSVINDNFGSYVNCGGNIYFTDAQTAIRKTYIICYIYKYSNKLGIVYINESQSAVTNYVSALNLPVGVTTKEV